MERKMDMGSITVAGLEKKIFEFEGIRIVIRESKDLRLGIEYNYERSFSSKKKLKDFVKHRLSYLTKHDIEFDIISGYGTNPHSYTTIGYLRDSYVK